jgi:hypothetical protein
MKLLPIMKIVDQYMDSIPRWSGNRGRGLGLYPAFGQRHFRNHF